MVSEKSSLLNNFISLLKCEAGKDVSPFEAVFHRRYAKYRHLQYPGSRKESLSNNLLERTWINVILREGLSDEIRLNLFPDRFDLGNTSVDSEPTAKLAELLTELNQDVDSRRKEKLSKKDLMTTLEGIKDIVGYDLSDSQMAYPISSLKVIKRLHKLRGNRHSHLFGLIKPPHLGTPTPEFMDAAPDIFNSEDALFFSDLVSYLSVEIPEEKLNYIQQHILNYHELPARIAHENLAITEPIRARYHDDEHRIVEAYQEAARIIDAYQPVRLMMTPIPLDESLYTYLRTLPFQHFVAAQEKAFEISAVDEKINDVTGEMDALCSLLSEESKRQIYPNTELISVNEIPAFVRRYESVLRGVVKSAIGISVRRNGLESMIGHVGKILSIHIWRLRRMKDLDAVVISVADCIAALCAVRHQQDVKIPYESYEHGEKPSGTSPLRSFSKEEGIESLQEKDYISQAASQLMLFRFGRFRSYILGHGEYRMDAWSQFQVVRLKKYVQILQLYDIEAIVLAVRQFNRYCVSVVQDLVSSGESS